MLNKVIRTLLAVGMLAMASLLAFSLLRGQEGMVRLFSSAIHGRHAADKVREALTPSRMHLLQLFFFIAILALAALFRFSEPITKSMIGVYRDTTDLLIASWKTTVTGPGKWLLLLPFAVTVYGLLFIPLNFDEALTYFDFTTRGPLVTLTYYPYPNNHVLHSLITNFTRYLPFHALTDLRIMPVIVTLVGNMLCLNLISKLYGNRMAWVITACCTTVFFSLYYGYMSRGYYLVTLLFLVCFYCAERLARGDASDKHRTAFILASIAGFFTMPSFLYPFASLCLYMVLRNNRLIWAVTLMGIRIVPTVILLYLPIMVVSGVSALISNPYVKPVGRAEVVRDLPQFLGSTITEMTGFHWIWTFALLLIAALHAFFHGQRSHLRDMAFFLAMPVLILLAHSVVPFPRTFNYYVLILGLLILLPFARYLNSLNARGLVIGLVFVQALFCWRFFQVIAPYEDRDPQVNMTAWNINKRIMGDKKYFCAGTLMGTNLWFELETRFGYKDRITFRDKPVNADTLRGYDHIIVGRLLDSTRTRKAEYASPYFTIYGADDRTLTENPSR